MSSINTKQIIALIKKDLLLETRQQYTFYGIALYVISTVFVVYLAMGQPDEHVWNGLFWMVQLFVCINAVAKSFLSESNGRMLYFFSITSPQNFIIAKLFYNALLMLLMTALTAIVFLLFLNNPFVYLIKFFAIAFLGGLGLSLIFTFLAAIAAKARQNAALMAIMGFPIIIPQILLLMKVSSVAFSDVVQMGFLQMIGLLVAFDALVILLAYILFPFLWKE